MKNLRPLFLAAAFLLIGAGCEEANSNANVNASADVDLTVPSDDKNEDTSEATPADEAEKPADAAAAADATWETYVNKATGIEFKWPTRGRYAPQWTFSSETATSAKIKDGCYAADGAADPVTVKAGETTYCRTTAKGDANTVTWYVTKVGPNFAVLTFTKANTAVNAPSFSWDEYLKHLDEIAATLIKK